MKPLYFQFEETAAVEVCCEVRLAREFFEAEYGYHAVDRLAQGLPRVRLAFELDGAAPVGFTRHTHKGLARWSYSIDLQPNLIDLRVHGNRFAVPMVHHMLVHPALRWLAAQNGTLLLHAGAVAKSGRSLVLTGKGGAGKTTTTSLILASGGWQLHADDYVFLRPGTVRSLAYVTRSHLYRDLLKWVPQVSARLTFWERVRLEFFGALRRYSGERLKWPVRLEPGRLWPENSIAASARPAAVLLLERGELSAPRQKSPGLPQLIPLQELESTVNDLLEMNFGEARHFLTLLKKAGRLDPAWLEAWQLAEHTLLAGLLSEIPAYRLILPRNQSAQEVNASLLPLLDGLLAEAAG